jgi:hypothetical protein
VGTWIKELDEFLDFIGKVFEVILKLGPLFGEVVESRKGWWKLNLG